MKAFAALTLSLISTFSMSLSIAAEKTTYYCQASKSADYYDSDLHYEAVFEGNRMNFSRIYNNSVAKETTREDYEYETQGTLQGGSSRLTGLMIYDSKKPMECDSQDITLYATPELKDGGALLNDGKRGGQIKFVCSHYSYETYYCFVKRSK